jgi:NADPH:quinone reductase-like Zn-dependent oxidoreductase
VGHLERGTFAPVIDRTFPLDQIVQAHAYMDANQANGKIVVTVS